MNDPLRHAPLAAMLLLASLLSAPAASAADPGRPWMEEMEQFEEADAESPPQPGGIVFVGSSSIRLWDLEKYFPNLKGPVLNRGFGGSEIEDSVSELPLLVLRHQPRAIVLYAGDNDVAAGKSAEVVAEDFDRFVAGVRSHAPKTPILFIAIKPSTARWSFAETMTDANERIRQQCGSDPTLTFIDIWTPMLGDDGRPQPELLIEDGLHMTDAGYTLWTRMVLDALPVE